MLYFSKWENMLFLADQDPSILLFLTPVYSTAVLSEFRIAALLIELWFYKKNAVRIINFQPRNSLLKFKDKVCLENVLFFSKSLSSLTLSVFNTWFSFSSD